MVTGVFDEPLEGYKGPTGCCIMSQEFYETDRARGFVRGYSFEILRGFGPVSTALWGMRRGACRGAPTTIAPTPSCSIAPPAWWRSARTCPRTTTASRSIPSLTDSDGIPAPKITYRLSDNSTRDAGARVARGDEVLRARRARATPSSRRRCRSPAGT